MSHSEQMIENQFIQILCFFDIRKDFLVLFNAIRKVLDRNMRLK